MAIDKFTDLFEVSTLGQKELEFIGKLKDLLDEHRPTIEFPKTDNPEEQTFFMCLNDLRGDKIFSQYDLRAFVNLEKENNL